MDGLNYIKKLQNQKKKSVTITIDESVLEELTQAAEKLDVSRNQIISDSAAEFLKTYKKWENPKYYVINSNNIYAPEGYLHMIKGNRVSAWGDTKSSIDSLEPGDYVFIYHNEVGFIASGEVTSSRLVNDYSLVRTYDTDSSYDIWDEHFAQVDYEKTSLAINAEIDKSTVVTSKEFKEHISKKPLNRTKFELSKEEGEKLKEYYLNK